MNPPCRLAHPGGCPGPFLWRRHLCSEPAAPLGLGGASGGLKDGFWGVGILPPAPSLEYSLGCLFLEVYPEYHM